MDFLKTLVHEGTQQAAHPQPPATANNDKGRNLVDQIANLSIGGNGNHPHTSSTANAKQEGLFDKIGSALGSGGSSNHTTAPGPASVTTPAHKQGGFVGNLTDALRHEVNSKPESAASEGLLGKISSQVGGEHKSTTAASKGGLLGQLSDALGSHATNKTDSAQTGLLGKIGGVLEGHKTEPAKPQGLGDKINHMLGGGAAGEQKEGEEWSISFFVRFLLTWRFLRLS